MPKSTKLKVVKPILATREAVEITVADTCDAQLKRESLTVERDARIKLIKDQYDPKIEEQDDVIATNLTLLEQWADANTGEFGDARSMVISGARLGYRLGNPAVKPAGKLTFKAIIAGLQKLGEHPLAKKYLRVKTEFDKDAALSTGRLVESTDESVATQADHELTTLGVEIVQAETFYLDPPREGQADVVLTKKVA